MGEDLENEIWKDVEGWEGIYQVSNTGRVREKQSKRLLHVKKKNKRKF